MQVPENPSKNKQEMSLQEVNIGEMCGDSDQRQTVRFEGLLLTGGGRRRVLFITSDNRYVIHECRKCSFGHNRWVYKLFEVKKEQLMSGGYYGLLGKEAGLWPILSLEDALKRT